MEHAILSGSKYGDPVLKILILSDPTSSNTRRSNVDMLSYLVF